jgi:CBS domain containing-hemolysin-like protein
MPDSSIGFWNIVLAVVLVALNAFFVAAEFALVKVRVNRLDDWIIRRRAMAGTAKWLVRHLDESLSTCQLGITIASLGLGWIGEPAFARLLAPLFQILGIRSEALMHGLSFVIAFSFITAVHLVIGEQAPKIYAIRRPEITALWLALPMRFFFLILFPFVKTLDLATRWTLRLIGMDTPVGSESFHTEGEIRALLREAHIQGGLTRSEHRLINAVLEIDDTSCRQIMVPRADVVFFDYRLPFDRCLEVAKKTRHTRYPVCDGSLDKVLGVVHMKDLIGISPRETFDIRTVMRPPRKVPEMMPISGLLREFQATRQLLAFVVDEYGTTIGVVTLENVVEEIVGPVEDEFDVAEPSIIPLGDGQFMVLGSTPIAEVEQALQLNLDDEDVDTVSGVLMTRAQKLPEAGDRIEFDGAVAEILEVKSDRAKRIRFTLTPPDEPESSDVEKPSNVDE